MRLKIKYSAILLLLALLVSALSCKNDDDSLFSDDNNSSEIEAFKSLEIRPGTNKVLLRGVVDDPKVAEVMITWDDAESSITIPVDASNIGDTIQQTINNLEERLYIFKVQNLDNSGNSSELITAGVQVFGSEFATNATNRSLVSNTLLDTNLDVSFSPTAKASGIIGTEIIYKNTSGEYIELTLNPEKNSLTIPDYLGQSPFKFRSVFVPAPMALDTVYTAYTEASFEPIPEIIFVTDDSSDDDQINWLREQGFYVSIYYEEAFGSAPQSDIDDLNDADLIIIGRSGSSGDFDGAEKTAWNSLTAPIILNSQWMARSNRLNWFDHASNPVEYAPGNDDVVDVKINFPTDAVFKNVTLSGDNTLPWLQSPNNLLYINKASNGEVLAYSAPGEADNDEGGSVLFVRFPADTEFYEGAGESAAGQRTYFGFGIDFGGDSLYFLITDEAKSVYLEEINRLIN